MKKIILLLLACSVLLFSCSTSNVQRIAGTSGYDISGNWNNNDIEIICNQLIESCLKSPWEMRFKAEKGNVVPVIVIGNIYNNSSEHIDTSIISKQIEKALVNSGSAQIAADINFRDDLRREKESQQFHASLDTAVVEGQEVGANFILQGTLTTVVDTSLKQAVKTYRVALELIDIQTGLKCWTDEKVVNKYIQRAKYKF